MYLSVILFVLGVLAFIESLYLFAFPNSAKRIALWFAKKPGRVRKAAIIEFIVAIALLVLARYVKY